LAIFGLGIRIEEHRRHLAFGLDENITLGKF